jgi:hypothetical protein
MFCRLATLVVFSICPAVAEVSAQNSEPAQKFPSPVESIVSGMVGIVSATDQLNSLGRSVDRLYKIRSLIAQTLVDRFNSSRTLTFDKLDNITLLCLPRGEHAARAAERSFLSTVSSQATEVATPGKIATLIDAIGVIFKHYSINVGELANPSEIKARVIANCSIEIEQFAATFYGMAPTPEGMKDLQVADEELKGISDSASLLFEAINAIINPLAKEFDRQYREWTVASFLFKNRDKIKDSAERLAKLSSNFGYNSKMRALGQFSEGAAVLRGRAIDLGKTDFCKDLKPDSIALVTKDDPQDSKQKIVVPTEEFMRCYAAVWKQVADVVTATLIAADEYDQFADAVKGDEAAKARKISDQISRLGEPTQINLKNLWEDAVRLVAFGEMVKDAFSKERRDNLNSAIASLAKGL